jgi:SAM-dependent methyltransferase
MDWVEHFYSTRGRWFGPTGIFAEHRARAADVGRLCGPGAKRILELGAGSGGTAAAMADLGHSVVALELSPVRVQFARDLARNRSNLTVLEADFYTVDLRGRFDVVCYWDGFGVGTDEYQRRLLRRVSHEWLAPAGVMLLDVFSPSFWAARAGQQERIETVSRLVDGEVRTVRLDVPVMPRYGFDREASRFISEWWPEGRKEETTRECVRCYTPAAFVELLGSTGLVADRFEVDGRQVDLNNAGCEVSVLFANNRSYRARLTFDTVRGVPT